jgi:hypothetical protein
VKEGLFPISDFKLRNLMHVIEPMDTTFKKDLKKAVLASIQKKAADLTAQLMALQEASNADTKSSMGDKYETSRESINQSRGLLEKQRALLIRSAAIVEQIPIGPTTIVASGALFKIHLGWIWVAASVGKITCQSQEVQVVSIDSPLIMALKGKRKGENVIFRGQKTEIIDLL